MKLQNGSAYRLLLLMVGSEESARVLVGTVRCSGAAMELRPEPSFAKQQVPSHEASDTGDWVVSELVCQPNSLPNTCFLRISGI